MTTTTALFEITDFNDCTHSQIDISIEFDKGGMFAVRVQGFWGGEKQFNRTLKLDEYIERYEDAVKIYKRKCRYYRDTTAHHTIETLYPIHYECVAYAKENNKDGK